MRRLLGQLVVFNQLDQPMERCGAQPQLIERSLGPL
jgi:hypothetical protein